MSYVTAVIDRVLADVTNKTAKGLWNVSDWTRVYGNAKLTSALAGVELGTPVAFNVVTAPTITTIASVIDFNILLANIERLRLAVVGESIPGTTTEIKDDWVAGINEDAPDYTDANLWESTIDSIWNYYDGPGLDVCPTLAADLVIPTGTTKIIVDCVRVGNYKIIPEGTGKLAMI